MTTRVGALAIALTDDQAFLVTKPANVRYLSGYSGSNGILLVSRNEATLFTDSRYAISSKQECFDVEIEVTPDLIDSVCKKGGFSELFFESGNLTVAIYNRLQNLLPSVKFSVSSNPVEALRVVKDQRELELISTACQIATAALSELVSQSLVGNSEIEISRTLEAKMIELGADSIAFETIVATGPNSAIAHHQPTNRQLQAGEFLKIDFGAKIAGYHSDCTRTFIAGDASQWQLEIYEQVQLAQSASRAALANGVALSSVVEPTIKQFESSGFLDKFGHGLGHGVGLEIHEDPFLSVKSTATLERGTVVTVEPGLYLAQKGGVRIEDTVVVTETGYENLTNFPHELLQIS